MFNSKRKTDKWGYYPMIGGKIIMVALLKSSLVDKVVSKFSHLFQPCKPQKNYVFVEEQTFFSCWFVVYFFLLCCCQISAD